MIKIAVAGANGRVGQLLVQAIQDDPQLTLVTTILRSDPKDNKNSSIFLSDLKSPIDVWIEFTTPAATLEHLAIAQAKGIKMVIGTTGFSEDEKKRIQSIAMDIPIVLSPNMSIGVNMIFKLL